MGCRRSSHVIKHLLEVGIYRTTNGGVNWIQVNSSGHFTSVFFMNHNIGGVTGIIIVFYWIFINQQMVVLLGVKRVSISSSSMYFLDINNGWATGVMEY